MKRRLVVIATVLAIAALAVAPAVAATTWKSWARSSVSGKGPFTTVASTVGKPDELRYRVEHSQDRKVSVDWMISCERGSRFGSKSGTHTVTPPATRTLPVPVSDPDSCDIMLMAGLANYGTGSGRLTITGQKR